MACLQKEPGVDGVHNASQIWLQYKDCAFVGKATKDVIASCYIALCGIGILVVDD